MLKILFKFSVCLIFRYPYLIKLQSQGEGEAQCSILAKEKTVYAAVTEDMDCLPFGAPYLIRDINNGNTFIEIELESVLLELGINFKQFIDFCILCGCDYTSGIKGNMILILRGRPDYSIKVNSRS